MSASDRDQRFGRPALEAVFAQAVTLPLQHLLFIVVSTLDALLTLLLLQQEGIYETNPFARYFLDSWGPPGMLGFKFTLVAFVCFLTHIIACTRVETARRLLNFASLIVASVVLYSFALFVLLA